MSKIKLVDVHAHLNYPPIDKNLDKVISNAKKAGVVFIIANGTDMNENKIVLEHSEKYDIVKPALGIYPTHFKTTKEAEEVLDFIEKNKDKIIAIGEVGMDFKEIENNDEKEKKKQEIVFRKIVELSKKIDKPLIVHSRKAEEEVIDILEEMKAKKVVMHCFSGKKSLIKRIIENDWYVSIPCTIVRTLHFQMLAEMVNINRILTETDAPFLSPFREKYNEPAYVFETIKKIAEIKGMEVEEVANNVFMNFQKLFL